MYQQVKPFNQSKGGSKKGSCLQNVRLGYGIAPKFDDAWTAWKNTEQHKDRSVPKGLDVPVYFSYTTTISEVRKNYGHIGVRLKSGKFWSDGWVYSSLSAYEKNHTPKYVGWGESVNDVQVIKQGEDMYKGKSAKYWHDEWKKELNNKTIWRNRFKALSKPARDQYEKFKHLFK